MPVSPITAVLSRVMATIPRVILEKGFEPKKYRTSLDERILEEVVRRRVLIDINTNSGKLTKIPLRDQYREDVSSVAFMSVLAFNAGSDYYRIPPEAREYRDINVALRCLTITGYGGFGDGTPYPMASFGNSLANTAQMALASRTLDAEPRAPMPILHDGNIIEVAPRLLGAQLMLECLLEYDAEFTNLPNSAIPQLTDLIGAATKAWLHNNLIIAIDMGEVVSGAQIGAFKQKVEEYRDAETEYNELVRKFKAAAVQGDPKQMAQLILLAI
jgi:hypothetical protein